MATGRKHLDTTTKHTVWRSRISPGRGYLGEIPEDVWEVVNKSWAAPFGIASNFARMFAPEVAMAASLGWITNISPDGQSYSRTWHVTLEGLSAYHSKKD